jgi:hypothetical protein
MDEFAVGRDAVDDGVAVLEVAVEFAEAGNFGRADEGEREPYSENPKNPCGGMLSRDG